MLVKEFEMSLPPVGQHTFDYAVLGVIVSTWFQVIPSAAAFLAFIWYIILIWESKTVRNWTGRIEKSTTYVVTETHPDQPDQP